PHDSLGSNLVVQVKQSRVMRVLPLENEAINECWLSDKDRFSYEGLNSPERLTQPMVKRDGQWREADWEEAFDRVLEGLKGQDFGILASPHATLEELHLVSKLGPADFRLRHSDFSADGKREGIPWLGMPIAELGALDQVLVVGSFLRKEAPLIAHRLRQAAKRGAQIHMLHSVDDEWLMPVASRRIVPPGELPGAIAAFQQALARGRNAAVLIGNFAQQHPQAAQIHLAAQALGFKLGFIGEAANSVGGYVAGLPTASLDEVVQKKALLLLNVEPQLDCANPQAIAQAGFVVLLTPWRHSLDKADVLLPIAPFTETPGTFVNTEGRAQSFHATVNALGEARPGWKVLRVLGSLLGRPGFDFDSVEQVRAACLGGRDIASRLSNGIRPVSVSSSSSSGIQRIADVPIYFADPLVRRSPALQKTPDARPPKAWMNARLMQKFGLSAGQQVLVNDAVRIACALDDRLPDDCVRIAAAHRSTAGIGPMFGSVTLEKVAVGRAA
ncbi:MAG: molybdopterin-dependent oxidoreductase, partial [Burkholderiales bacterium]